MSDRRYNVLFLCTGNSARSILAESILRKDGAGRFNAFSAGSHPKGEINPFALKVLTAYGYPTDGFRSKSWDEVARPGTPSWISFSPSATMPRTRPARFGRASR
jgi:arsenate reductase